MSIRKTILESLIASEMGKVAKAEANVEIYLLNPVGIGEHPDVLASINDQIDIIAEAKERIEVLTQFQK